MANPDHVEIVRSGHKAIFEWKNDNPGQHFDLQGADFSRETFNDIDFSGDDFSEAILTSTNFQGANLDEAKFVRAQMVGAVLSNTDMMNCRLNSANLSHAFLNEANLENAQMQDVILDHSTIQKSNLRGTNFNRANLSSANLSKSDLNSSIVTQANLDQAVIKDADLSRAKLDQSIMNSVELQGATLTGTSLVGVSLNYANLREALIDSTTVFRTLDHVYKCEVDRYTMEYMRDHLRHAQKMDLIVSDDIALLRSRYSGVWQWVHVLSLSTFCAPYIWFIFKQWSRAKFIEQANESDNSIQLGTAILRHIWNGGVNWQKGWDLDKWSFGCFVLVFIYNVFRVSLLWKTKRLETDQDVSGLPVKFSLGNSGWSYSYNVTYYGFWLMLALVAYNTFHFLSMRIPVNFST